jgi:hypothetical protein
MFRKKKPLNASTATSIAAASRETKPQGWWKSLFGSTTPDKLPQQEGMARKPMVELSDEQKAALEDYYVRIRYNDRVMQVPGCKPEGKHLDGDTSFCTLVGRIWGAIERCLTITAGSIQDHRRQVHTEGLEACLRVEPRCPKFSCTAGTSRIRVSLYGGSSQGTMRACTYIYVFGPPQVVRAIDEIRLLNFWFYRDHAILTYSNIAMLTISNMHCSSHIQRQPHIPSLPSAPPSILSHQGIGAN